MKVQVALLVCVLCVPVRAAAASDEERAKEIVQAKCFICHGVDGESSSPVFPRLSGQHANYVARQLADYHSGRRKSDTMRPMVEDLSPADFVALGRYFESRTPIAHQPDDAGLAQVGRFIFDRGNPYAGIPSCASCHGLMATVPTLCRAWQVSMHVTGAAAEEIQLARAHERQRGDAHRGFQADRTRGQGGVRLHSGMK